MMVLVSQNLYNLHDPSITELVVNGSWVHSVLGFWPVTCQVNIAFDPITSTALFVSCKSHRPKPGRSRILHFNVNNHAYFSLRLLLFIIMYHTSNETFYVSKNHVFETIILDNTKMYGTIIQLMLFSICQSALIIFSHWLLLNPLSPPQKKTLLCS